jgi:hypothetical protein
LHIVKPLSGGSLDVVLETKDTTANNTLYFDNNAGKGLRIHTYGTAVSGTLLDGTVNRANASVIRTNDVTYPIIIGGLSTSAQNVYFGQNNISLAINNATQSVSVGTGAFAGYKFDVNGTARITSTLEVDSLAGVGNRMVVADASGVLSTQSIPTGSITGNGAIGQVTYWNSATTITGSNSLFWDIAGASLGIGSNALTGYGIRIGRNITGATISAGVYQSGAVQSDVSTLAVGFSNTADVSAGVVANAYHHFRADQSTFGAGATLAFQAGFFVTSTLTSATNNYGFYGNLASGIGRWNLFMAGTAPSYFNGVVTIGTSTPNTSAKVQIDSTTQGFLPPRMTLSQKNLITTPAEGLIVYQTDGTKGLYVYDGASWRAITII